MDSSYSEFSLLGDLSNYNFETLELLIKQMNVNILQEFPSKRVQWEDENTLYIIEFDLLGRFVQIEEQIWKNP